MKHLKELGLNETAAKKVITEMIEELMVETKQPLMKVIGIVSSYYDTTRDEIQKYLYDTKFDSRKGTSNYVYSIIKYDDGTTEELSANTFVSIFNRVITLIVRDIVKYEHCDIYTATVHLLDMLKVGHYPQNYEIVGTALKNGIRTRWNTTKKDIFAIDDMAEIFESAFGLYKNKISNFVKSAGNNDGIKKILGSNKTDKFGINELLNLA